MKPQRVYQCMNNNFSHDTCFVSMMGLSQIAGRAIPPRLPPAPLDQLPGRRDRSAGPFPAALGVRAADPTRKIVALSGDYDFQFMIEELAVGAQFKLPYIHIVVNNSYLGLIRQAQRGFEMDYCVQLALRQHQRGRDAASSGYGVDHLKVVEGLGCKAIRVNKQEEIDAGHPPRRGS